MRTVMPGLILLGAVWGCNSLEPDEDRRVRRTPAAEEPAEADASAGESGPVTFTAPVHLRMTASWERRPVDYLIIRENSAFIDSRDYPFAGRLYREGPDASRAMQELAIRLYFSGNDLRVGFVEPMFANDDAARVNAGALLRGSEASPEYYLHTDSANFVDKFVTRSAVAHGTEISNGRAHNNAHYNYPMKALNGVLNETTRTGSPTEGFLRNEAFLSILYIGYTDPVKEATDSAWMIEQLNAKRGAGNWKVSVLAPPAEGCRWTANDGTDIHTNEHSFAANTTDPDAIKSWQRQDKMLRLQTWSEGLFFSICETDYTEFMKEFAGTASANSFFPVILESAPVDDNIIVSVDDQPVTGWRYDKVSRTLLIPTTISSGTEFEISYTGMTEEGGDAIVEAPESSIPETIPEISGGGINPSEITYIESIRGIMVSNGCIGCHPAYGSYDGAWRDRDRIVARIILEPADPLSMPQNSDFDSEASRQAIIDWVNGS